MRIVVHPMESDAYEIIISDEKMARSVYDTLVEQRDVYPFVITQIDLNDEAGDNVDFTVFTGR